MAEHDYFHERGQALEDIFFAKQEAELKARLAKKRRDLEDKKAISEATGIMDDQVLSALVEHNLRSETLAALSLIPLLEVAWADRKIKKEERSRILEAAHEKGIYRGTEAYALLESWLHAPPDPKLFEAWKDYIEALSRRLSPEEMRKLKEEVIGRARAVAEAEGGYMIYVGDPISKEQHAALEKLEQVFPA